MNEAIKIPENVVAQLKAPLPPEAVTQHPTKAYLSSIKVIYEHERLNEVFGLNGWEDRYEFIEREGKMVVVKGYLTVPAYGIKREAFGGNDNPDLGDAYKGACTDALSKMCSSIFIGMDVYKGLANTSSSPAVRPQAPKPAPAPPKPPQAPKAAPERKARPLPQEFDVAEFRVTAISKKPTKKGGFSWGFKDENGKWWNTFEAAVGDVVEKGETYRFATEQQGQYTNIVGFAPEVEDLPPAADYDPQEINDQDIPF